MPRKIPILTPEEAVALIPDGATVAFSGAGGGITEATALIDALAERYRATETPKGLTLLHATGLGDRADRGMSPLAQKGLSWRIVGGHWDQSPRLATMAAVNEFEAYNLPMGTFVQLYRASAAGQPGILTKVGIGTFEDPRQRGGKLNDVTTEDLVRLVEIDGEEWLLYKALKPDICLIRGTTADTSGHVSMEDDIYLDVLDIALATHNNGGKVIVQVQRVVKQGTLHPKSVVVPGYLVDALVVIEAGQVYGLDHTDRFLSGDYRVDLGALQPIPLTERKVVARRALMAAGPGMVGNLGVGIADGIGVIAGEEGLVEDITLTIELGIVGGVTRQGVTFGASVNMEAMITMANQFAFYDGGGLDICYLSFAEFDRHGNVNVSRFGGKIVGTGGFINISQNSKRVVFCGTLTAGGLRTKVGDGRMEILQEGRVCKCPEEVEEITFNGRVAYESGQEVYFVTERAVFRLGPDGVELSEYAPGIDVERDIVAHMAFRPKISPQLKEMDPRIFREERMGLKSDWEV